MKDGENQPSALTQSVCSTHVITHNVMMPCHLELVCDWLKGSMVLWSVLYNMPCKDLPLPRTTHNHLGGLFDLECTLHH